MNPLWQFAGRMRRAWSAFWTHKDRVGPIDVNRVYGSHAEVAARPWKYAFDLECKDVNANVSIAVRAESDAVKSLPMNIIGVEIMAGVDREFDDNEHPANAIINDPNPRMTMREVITHVMKSLLGDGNGILTIERQTGPNARIEIWPRDPRNMTPEIKNGVLTGYRFEYENKKIVYPPNRVVHIRDVNPEEPFWGKSRFEAVRTEIYMDYLINEFNKNFFLNGTTLNLMFIPEKLMSESQHEQLTDALKNQQGAERAFKLWVNMFPGKLTSPEMKHKDIAFGDLLKHNREKIFGAFGLPPFRGGVMEYANYANALAQDKDFWLNTIMPLTSMIEDALNKQLVWPYFGREVSIRFDFTEVPALKGDPKERAEIHAIYIKNRVMSPKQVCEELGIEPPDEADLLPATPSPEAKKDPDDEDDDAAPKPTKDEKKEAENALLSLFKCQRRDLTINLRKHTKGGSLMSKLIFEEQCTNAVFILNEELDRAEHTVGPALINAFRSRTLVVERVPGTGVASCFSPITEEHHNNALRVSLDGVNRETSTMLTALLSDALRYRWDLHQLSKRTRHLFSRERAIDIAHRLVDEAVRRAEVPKFAEESTLQGGTV